MVTNFFPSLLSLGKKIMMSWWKLHHLICVDRWSWGFLFCFCFDTIHLNVWIGKKGQINLNENQSLKYLNNIRIKVRTWNIFNTIAWILDLYFIFLKSFCSLFTFFIINNVCYYWLMLSTTSARIIEEKKSTNNNNNKSHKSMRKIKQKKID